MRNDRTHVSVLPTTSYADGGHALWWNVINIIINRMHQLQIERDDPIN